MRTRAIESWPVADSCKYGRAGFVHSMNLADLTGVITDSGIDVESPSGPLNTGISAGFV